jgi:hypothetical protein
MAEAFSQLTEVFLADMGATWAGVLQEPVMEEGRHLGKEAVQIARERMPVHTSDLHVRGSEIQVLPPLTVGDAMKYLLARVQSGSVPNERGALLQALGKKLEKITKAE